MSVSKNTFSLRQIFGGALMLGAASLATNADAYSIHGRGGSGQYAAEGSYSTIILDYPNGEEKGVWFPRFYDRRNPVGALQQQESHDLVVPVLREYVRDILPQMGKSKYEEFAWIVSRVSEYYPDITDTQSFSNDIGYDYAYVARYEVNKSIDDFRYLQNDLKIAYYDKGYRIYPKAIFHDEGSVDRFNEVLAKLKAEYPHHRAYQIRPYTYNVLSEARRELGDVLAVGMVKLLNDFERGRLDPSNLDGDVQEYVGMLALMLSDAENLDDRSVDIVTKPYNALMPVYIDQALEEKYGLTEDQRNELYRRLFEIRAVFDLRPMPNEDKFLAGQDVIAAPKP